MTTPFAEGRPTENVVERARYEATLRIARVLRLTYATRRTRERLTSADGREVFAKRNLIGAGLLRLGGNVLQRLERTGGEFLDDAEWFEREATMSRLLERERSSVSSDGTLLEPRIPGVDLATILRAVEEPLDRKLHALERCTTALQALHAAGVTHADATCENVLVDGGEAHWIDFETRHRPDLPRSVAQADDLRALVFSSVWAADGRPSEIARRAFDAYPEPRVWQALANLRSTTSGSLVRIAQAPMRWRLYAATWAALLDLTATLRSS